MEFKRWKCIILSVVFTVESYDVYNSHIISYLYLYTNVMITKWYRRYLFSPYIVYGIEYIPMYILYGHGTSCYMYNTIKFRQIWSLLGLITLKIFDSYSKTSIVKFYQVTEILGLLIDRHIIQNISKLNTFYILFYFYDCRDSWVNVEL